MTDRVRARNGRLFGWTRRAVFNLKVGDIISPEYSWAAKILKIYPNYENPGHVWIICDPTWVAKQYLSAAAIQDEIVGPHLFGLHQRPLFWNGPDDIVAAFKASRFNGTIPAAWF